MVSIKSTLIAIGYALLIFGMTYMMGAFSEATFNITEWNENTRGLTAGVGGFCAIIAFIASIVGTITIKVTEDETT